MNVIGRPPAPEGDTDLQTTTREGSEVHVWRLPPDCSDDEAKEVLLYIKSEHKKAGDRSIVTRNRQQFELQLQKLHQGCPENTAPNESIKCTRKFAGSSRNVRKWRSITRSRSPQSSRASMPSL